MIVDKYGRVAGSIDLATLADMYAQSDDDDLRDHYRQIAAENGLDLDESSEIDFSSPQMFDAIVKREDGVHSVGGGWHEVTVAGVVVDKIRGVEAAQEAYEAYQEANSGDDQLP